MQVTAFVAGVQRLLEPGDVLHHGTKFTIVITVAWPAHVYAALSTERTPPQVIFPPSKVPSQLAPPGIPTHLPQGGAYFTLDNTAGKETVYAVGSFTPLSVAEVQAAITTAFQEAGQQSSPAQTADGSTMSRGEPEPVTTRNRNYDYRKKEFWAPLLPGRPAVIRFDYDHRQQASAPTR